MSAILHIGDRRETFVADRKLEDFLNERVAKLMSFNLPEDYHDVLINGRQAKNWEEWIWDGDEISIVTIEDEGDIVEAINIPEHLFEMITEIHDELVAINSSIGYMAGSRIKTCIDKLNKVRNSVQHSADATTGSGAPATREEN
jgi:hypothetical protein